VTIGIGTIVDVVTARSVARSYDAHHTMIVPIVMTSQRGPAVGLGGVASF
jgi:hypothetical protein